MNIQKFQGKTQDEALALARSVLGADCVVMSTRAVKKKGLLGLFSKAQIEVTAAVEDAEDMVPRRASAGSASVKPVSSKPEYKGRPVHVDMVTPDAPAPAVSPKPADYSQADTLADIENISEKIESLRNLLSESLVVTKPAAATASPDSEVVSAPQTKTLDDKKPETLQVKEPEPVRDSELTKFIVLLRRTLADNEVEAQYIDQVVEEIERSEKPGMPFDYALNIAYQKLVLKFGTTQIITPASRGPKIIFFVGPTGAGKTTTIAKLASRLSIGERKSVTLLTTDTYRLAAAEQLRTYANIFKVPFRVIYKVDEFESAVTDYKSSDYIFVDTAGHSYKNTELREGVFSYINAADKLAEKEVYVTLSASTKYKDLLRVVQCYKDIKDFRVVFTKLDETEALGNMLNVRLSTGANLSYVTMGQNVPEDIETFNPQSTVKKLLGGK